MTFNVRIAARFLSKGAAVLAILMGEGLLSCQAAQSPVVVSVDLKTPGPNLSSSFSGLSYEMSLLLPGKNGKYFFSPDNKPLLQMFRTLGIKSLRVGGNTAERDTVPIPGKADIDSLFGFAKAAGVRVLYTLRLKDADPAADAEIAKYILEHHKDSLSCFILGNEPEKMAPDYPAYREVFARFMAVISAPTNCPEARFCGPSTTHKNALWAGNFARDFARDKRVVLVTQHEYPARSGLSVTNAAIGCDKLLSPDLFKTYESFHNEFVPAAQSNGLPYRLEEANSYSNGGAPEVSDAFASALWGLDYLYWWAVHGAEGINFHTGGYAPGAQPKAPMKYAVFWNDGDGYDAHPLAYALKAFALGGAGKLVSVILSSNPDQLNVTAYGVFSADNYLCLVLINKEHGLEARGGQLTLEPGGNCVSAQVMWLTVPGADVQAKTGVTLGGAAIKSDGSWNGSWERLEAPSANGQFKLSLPAATAAIVRLAPK